MTPNELILAGGFALVAAVGWGLYFGERTRTEAWRKLCNRFADELTELRAFKANQDDIRQRANAKKRAMRAAKSA